MQLFRNPSVRRGAVFYAVLLAAGVTALCLRRAFDAVEAGPDGETPPENPAEQT